MISATPADTARFEDGLSADTYHAEKSLSKSGIGQLIDECPAKFWWNSPLNPSREREDSSTFDIGTAAHLMFLEPDLFCAKTVLVEGFTKDGKPIRWIPEPRCQGSTRRCLCRR